MLAWLRGVQDDPAQVEAIDQFVKYHDVERWPHHAATIERIRQARAQR